MARLVLIDAGPLIALSRVGGLNWLQALFGSVVVPEWVRAEVLDHGEWPGQIEIRNAITDGTLLVREQIPAEPTLAELDEGETACIRIALEHGEPALILMDEQVGRSVARDYGIAVAGTAAIIGMAKQQGLISSARSIFDELYQSDFRISANVINTILIQVGESAP